MHKKSFIFKNHRKKLNPNIQYIYINIFELKIKLNKK